MKRRGRSILVAFALMLATSTSLVAQESGDSLRLETSPSDSIVREKSTAAEIIQARAMEAARQRIARLEMRAWLGIDPARPIVAANPFTQSRYRVYVPVGRIWNHGDYVQLR